MQNLSIKSDHSSHLNAKSIELAVHVIPHQRIEHICKIKMLERLVCSSLTQKSGNVIF